MKRVILLLIVLIFIVGCNNINIVGNINATTSFNQKSWCIAQQNHIIINGHYYNLTNTKTKEKSECCCYGGDGKGKPDTEFVCFCPESTLKIYESFGKR